MSKVWLLQEDDLPHFVFFFTHWSKYCVRVAPAWEDLAEKYNNLEEKHVRVYLTNPAKVLVSCSDKNTEGNFREYLECLWPLKEPWEPYRELDGASGKPQGTLENHRAIFGTLRNHEEPSWTLGDIRATLGTLNHEEPWTMALEAIRRYWGH